MARSHASHQNRDWLKGNVSPKFPDIPPRPFQRGAGHRRTFGPWLLAAWCVYCARCSFGRRRIKERAMRTWLTGLALGACALLSSSATAQVPVDNAAVESLLNRVNIAYGTFTLDNGLRVVVHEDRKAPVVGVSIWYNVGSKDEPAGRTGFAHLFEHLMFNGSENAPGDYFEPLREIGATDFNGTTSFDRTNYFQTVPRAALERALFLESDRMGHLLGAVTQENLTNQIGVVQNEKRQGDNEPYGMVEYAQLEGLYPVGHPYHHSTIG